MFARVSLASSFFLFVFCLASLAGKPPEYPETDPRSLYYKPSDKKDYICFAMYTVHNRVMKMLAQLYPLDDGNSRRISLSVKKDGKWVKVAETEVRTNDYHMKGVPMKAWNALFRVEDWDSSRDWKYKITALDGVAEYTGVVKRDPVDKREIVVAAFTGNSNKDRDMRDDIVRNVKAIKPDLLFFSGDQSYDHKRHLYAWLLFGRQFGEIIRNVPTVCLPDDHDVGQGNLWGESGKISKRGGCDDGGYKNPAYVREVEFAQCANLPDPYDPTPVRNGIGVHYTSLNVGGIDFAIIEDRKFKTGPYGLVETPGHPRADLINDPDYDRAKIDVPEAKLLGERQLRFLREWGRNWRGVEMKCVLSATIFCQACHKTGPWRIVADLDSNGWPQTGRREALRTIRSSFAFMLAGDQHLATVVHHGVNDWNDAGVSFCVPSICNHWRRYWAPREKPFKRVDSPLKDTGEYLDGFGNKITMLAYANPGARKEKYGPKDVGGAGFGVVRFDKEKRTITMECWPRDVDVTRPDEYKQFPGWPITISQEDNYGRKAVGWLPRIVCGSMVDPVVQVVDEETGEVVYTIRIKGPSWRPKVFHNGVLYAVKVGGQGAGRSHVFRHVASSAEKTDAVLAVP